MDKFKYPDHVASVLSGAGCLECGGDVKVKTTDTKATTECSEHGVVEYMPDSPTPHFEHIKLGDFQYRVMQERDDALYCPYCGHKTLVRNKSGRECSDCGASGQELTYL